MNESEYIRSPESGESYHRVELRHVASEWHGGQFSALYAFSSSGTAVSGLAIEAIEAADKSADIIEIDKLRTIATLDPSNGHDPYEDEARAAGVIPSSAVADGYYRLSTRDGEAYFVDVRGGRVHFRGRDFSISVMEALADRDKFELVSTLGKDANGNFPKLPT
jgi:hypothetical protein